MTEVKKTQAKSVKTLKQQITEILSNEDSVKVDIFSSYMQKILLEIDKKTGAAKYPFMKTKTAKNLSDLFLRVKKIGLDFDGVHVTLQNTGVTFDYVAYKNKMLLAYPESKIDASVVKDGDTFTLENINGEVIYRHIIADPFKTADVNNITGAFCIIKNKRGEFATLLSAEDLAKHRKVAKGDFIWSAWYKEMVLKTVLKKGCKYHFDDIFEEMNEIDNESIDLEKVNTPIVDQEKVNQVIKKINSFKDIKKLQDYYAGLGKEFITNGDVFEAYNYQKDICKTTK